MRIAFCHWNNLHLVAVSGHPAGMRIHTVQRSDWRDYRQIRLAALMDAPSAYASTWQQEASLSELQWMDWAERSQVGESSTVVAAVDDLDCWVGVAGGFRPGNRGADAELIAMWVAPGCRRNGFGLELVRAVMAWAKDHGAATIGLWVTESNRAAIGMYGKAGFHRTGEADKLPSDPNQNEIRMLWAADRACT